MSEFAYPVYIKGTRKELLALIPKLIGLGYEYNGGWDLQLGEWPLNTMLGGNGKMGASAAVLNSTECIDATKEDLILALAGARKDGEFQVGEPVKFIGPNVFNFPDTIYIVKSVYDKGLSFGTSDGPAEYGSHIYNFKRPTKQEIIEFYRNKKEKTMYNHLIGKRVKVTNLPSGCKGSTGIGLVLNPSDISGVVSGLIPEKDGIFIRQDNGRIWRVHGTIEVLDEKKEARTVIGYKAPKDLFNGEIKAGTVYNLLSLVAKVYGATAPNNGWRSSRHNLPAEIVEDWEPVYEEKKQEFEIVGENKTMKGVFTKEGVIVDGEKLTMQAIEALLNSTLNYELFPWTVITNTVNIGCIEGVKWNSLKTLRNDYNNYLKNN